MTVVAWSVLAALLTVGAEALMKTLPPSWRAFAFMAPLAVLQQACFWRILQGSENLISAFVYFTVTISLLRIAITLWLGHPVGAGSWIALSFLSAAAIARWWRP